MGKSIYFYLKILKFFISKGNLHGAEPYIDRALKGLLKNEAKYPSEVI
jgi:hypothetical protein